MPLYRILLDPQGGPETGSPSPTPTVTTTSTAPVTPIPAPAGDPAEGFKALLAKHQNDSARVAEKLYDENHTHRQTIRDLKAKVPSEGSLVLNPDQAKAWTAYLELGKPEDMQTLKTEHGQLQAERAAAAKEKFHAEVAALHGYVPAVLSTLIDHHGLDVELGDGKERDKAGKLVKVALVKDADGKTTTPLPEYLKEKLPHFLPSLVAKAEARPVGTPRFASPGTLPEPPPAPPRRSLVK
jgi:hypothetical protein